MEKEIEYSKKNQTGYRQQCQLCLGHLQLHSKKSSTGLHLIKLHQILIIISTLTTNPIPLTDHGG